MGFEPTELLHPLVFKTSAISRTLPHYHLTAEECIRSYYATLHQGGNQTHILLLLCSDGRIRTSNTSVNSGVLCQLSYVGMSTRLTGWGGPIRVGSTRIHLFAPGPGFEPGTNALTVRDSTAELSRKSTLKQIRTHSQLRDWRAHYRGGKSSCGQSAPFTNLYGRSAKCSRGLLAYLLGNLW